MDTGKMCITSRSSEKADTSVEHQQCKSLLRQPEGRFAPLQFYPISVILHNLYSCSIMIIKSKWSIMSKAIYSLDVLLHWELTKQLTSSFSCPSSFPSRCRFPIKNWIISTQNQPWPSMWLHSPGFGYWSLTSALHPSDHHKSALHTHHPSLSLGFKWKKVVIYTSPSLMSEQMVMQENMFVKGWKASTDEVCLLSRTPRQLLGYLWIYPRFWNRNRPDFCPAGMIWYAK